MKCPVCGENVTATDAAYACRCTRIPKLVASRPLSMAEITQLVLDRATAEVLTGFVSRAGKTFNARLVIKNGKVVFDYSDSAAHDAPAPNTAFIRVEAFHSGTAWFFILGPVKKRAELSFGLVSAREAECLALITAVKYLQWSCRDYSRLNVTVSLNNRDLTAYVLRERKPRDAKVRQAVLYLLSLLSKFGGWHAAHNPKRKPRLRGGPATDRFPAGVFPWLQIRITPKDDHVEVQLPDDPAVIAQFRSSLRRATGQDGVFRLPLAAEKAAKAWIATVKTESPETPA